MARVPHCKGSYQERKSGDGWQVKFPLGWSEVKGRYDEYREEVASEAEAIALIKAINDFTYHGGSSTEVPLWRSGRKAEEASCTLTVEQFSDMFMEMRTKQKKVAPRTLETDRTSFERIRPYIGRKLLTAITAHDIDEAYARMRSDGSDNIGGRAYSGTTLQKTHSYLSMLFDKAVDYDYIAKNPVDKVERPKRDTAEKVPLTPEQAQEVFAHYAGGKLAAKPVGVLLCMGCGLRLSEMLVLNWSDYRNGALSVYRSQVKDKQDVKATKNEESRVVPCPPPVIEVLARWQEEQKAWYVKKELEWGEDAPIVSSRVGNHILQRSFDRWFKGERKKLPVPEGFTAHGLRHTYTTLLNRDCGTDPRTTRSMTGHKSEQAFAIYTHTNEEWQRKAAADLGSIIAPDRESTRCNNCKLWTASPTDATRGACWAEVAEDDEEVPVTEAVAQCPKGKFSMRMSA